MNAITYHLNVERTKDGVRFSTITDDGELHEMGEVHGPVQMLTAGPILASYLATLLTVAAYEVRS